MFSSTQKERERISNNPKYLTFFFFPIFLVLPWENRGGGETICQIREVKEEREEEEPSLLIRANPPSPPPPPPSHEKKISRPRFLFPADDGMSLEIAPSTEVREQSEKV